MVASPSFAQTASPRVEAIPVALDPPVNQDLVLTISDRRALPNGSTILFSITHRLHFSAVDGGWRVVVAQQSLDCAGLERACQTYRAVMAPGDRVERHFSLTREGAITLLDAPRSMPRNSAANPTGSNAPLIVAATEDAQPGRISASELREAVRFANAAAVRAERADIGMVRIVGDDLVEIGEQHVLDDAPAAMVRTCTSQVDRHTGLVRSSVTETRAGAAAEAPPISVRTWSLAPMVAPRQP